MMHEFKKKNVLLLKGFHKDETLLLDKNTEEQAFL